MTVTDDEFEYCGERGDTDPSVATVQAQQRIMQLKRTRDDMMNAVLDESHQALDDVRCRVITFLNERRKKESQARAAHVMKLVEATERRRDIENKMEHLAKELFSTIQELEQMMLKGYDGREEDLANHREKSGHSQA